MIWGARGSIPWAPDDPSEYGARTSCVEIRAGARRLAFDAGSGILALGQSLVAEGATDIDLYFTHTHYDHILGLPYFAPLYFEGVSARIHAGHMLDDHDCAGLVADYMRAPFHPVTPKVFRAAIDYRSFRPGDRFEPEPGLVIDTHRLDHPDGAVAYRVRWRGRSIVYATDHEHVPGVANPALDAFVAGADILVYDTTFVDAEMETYKGYGHSSVEEGLRIAERAGVGQLVLFHHSHKRSDAELRVIEAKAQGQRPGTIAARVGLEIALGPL
ncbi:MBL fold metallo-hydrolase [Aureimonas sp. AU12]|uniref:MBL fold metallo-hydrolase n=1 Tax=Aureimonas sp. AU12 TaxID=1638161 RepID=UPI000780ECDA|nr:MBL fold metallo-hydrolase [Aureimonas sp. AU12]